MKPIYGIYISVGDLIHKIKNFGVQSAGNKTLPNVLTTYDLLKTLALITMIIDHLGFYFFKDAEMFRVIGRMSMPIWFFLIGYARSRDLSPHLWIGAAILVAANVIAGLSILPLNILATVIFIRLVRDRLMPPAVRNMENFFFFTMAALVLLLPTGILFEYGTGALLAAFAGYAMRRKHDTGDRTIYYDFIFVTGLTLHGITQIVEFGFGPEYYNIMACCLMAVGFLLYYFKPKELPGLTKKLPAPFIWILKMCGRRSFELYVAHLLIFKFIAVGFGFPGFGWFNWSITEPLKPE